MDNLIRTVFETLREEANKGNTTVNISDLPVDRIITELSEYDNLDVDYVGKLSDFCKDDLTMKMVED